MKTVGYFEATPTDLLSRLTLDGVATLPVGHIWDSFGRNIELIRKEEVDLIVGWIHKILPVGDLDRTPKDMIWAPKCQEIPILLLVPDDLQEKAKAVLGEAAEFVTLVTRENVLETVKAKL